MLPSVAGLCDSATSCDAPLITNPELQQRMVRNTVSNYVRTAVAMIAGLVTFRLLYQHFDKEEFGFWSLLWSVFGYGILLDFGFGFAAQKRVAELSVAKDWAQLGRVLSSILVFYSGIALALAGTALLASPWLIEWFQVSPARSEEFRWVMVVFFAGIGLAFPMGIFPEIPWDDGGIWSSAMNFPIARSLR